MVFRFGLILPLAMGAVGFAQGPGRDMGGPMRGGGLPPDVRIIGGMPGRPDRVVKGAPFSAEISTETTQVLGDGNRIRQTAKAKIFRDSEGRERNEQSMAGLGAFIPRSNLSPVVYINDPIAGVDFALNVRDKTGTRFVRGGLDRMPPPSAPQAGGSSKSPQGQPQQAGGPPDSGSPWGRGGRRGGPPQNIKTESLGRQTIEGVPADGTRTIQTVPAGSEMGNEMPLQIISESWYSPDLRMVVYSKHSDPRSGETVFRLTNITRSEPPASLFAPPSDFKISTGAMTGGRGGMRRPQ
jgi:hypothetical protein